MVKAPSLLPNRGGALNDGASAHITSSSMSSCYKKKYKSWRKGKSSKHASGGASNTGGNSSSKSHGSLKQQLRGLQRLQQKKRKDREANSGTGNQDDHLQQQEQELQEKIDALQEQIQMRTISEKERINAKKSHKLRFIDRQRTTRLYQQYMKQLQQLPLPPTDSNDTTEDFQRQRDRIHTDLFKLALDQIYIAHFPLDRTSYVSVFNPANNSVAAASNTTPQQQQHRRTVMNNRLLHKMATQRQCIIERLHKSAKSLNDNSHRSHVNDDEDGGGEHDENDQTNNPRTNDKSINTRLIQPVSWIHPSQYERIRHLSTWSTQLERTTFNITIVNNNTSTKEDSKQTSSDLDDKQTSALDERFHNVSSTFNTTQQLLLQEQERMERELATLDEDKDNDDNELTTKGMKRRNPTSPAKTARNYDNDESDSSGEYEDNKDDEMDDDIVDPLQRSATAILSKASSGRSNDVSRTDTNNKNQPNDKITGSDSSKSSSTGSSEQSSDSDSIGSTNNATNTTVSALLTTAQNEVIAMATNLRNLASQKGKASNNNNNNNKSGDMEEEDDFFVALDEDIDIDGKHSQPSKNMNVFANAKRDTIRYSNNGIGDKSQGWATQKQLPGQFRKKQRR